MRYVYSFHESSDSGDKYVEVSRHHEVFAISFAEAVKIMEEEVGLDDIYKAEWTGAFFVCHESKYCGYKEDAVELDTQTSDIISKVFDDGMRASDDTILD